MVVKDATRISADKGKEGFARPGRVSVVGRGWGPEGFLLSVCFCGVHFVAIWFSPAPATAEKRGRRLARTRSLISTKQRPEPIAIDKWLGRGCQGSGRLLETFAIDSPDYPLSVTGCGKLWVCPLVFQDEETGFREGAASDPVWDAQGSSPQNWGRGGMGRSEEAAAQASVSVIL